MIGSDRPSSNSEFLSAARWVRKMCLWPVVTLDILWSLEVLGDMHTHSISLKANTMATAATRSRTAQLRWGAHGAWPVERVPYSCAVLAPYTEIPCLVHRFTKFPRECLHALNDDPHDSGTSA